LRGIRFWFEPRWARSKVTISLLCDISGSESKIT
jgi:hypothetical protein